MSRSKIELRLSFRQELLSQVAATLRSGECCSLVGVSGVGKSNFVQFLRRADVQAHYLNEHPSWLVLIDTHGLVFDKQASEEFVVAELIIHRLIRHAEQSGLAADTLAELERLHVSLITQPSALLAMRYLERICGKLIEGHDIRLIFMFDQFEDIWSYCQARLFLNLRALRDEFKYDLTYLVMTRHRLPIVREHTKQDSSTVEAFWELFSTHTYGIGSYSVPDALDMMQSITERSTHQLSPALQDLALHASGRHSGLLRAIYWVLHDQPDSAPSITSLAHHNAVWSECQKIWDDLSQEEQALLFRIAKGDIGISHSNGPLVELQILGLLVGNPPHIFSPVLADFVLQKQSIDSLGITVDPSGRRIWRDGIFIEERLTPLEFKLIEYLARHVGRICTRDELMIALYGDESNLPNDERLETVLRRLRKSIQDSEYIMTERGVGVRLTKGKIWGTE